MRIPFVGPSNQQDALTFDSQRSVNFYVMLNEVIPESSSLRGTPGLANFCEAGGGPIRGSITASNGRAFVVSSTEFYEINTDGTSTLHGALNSNTVRVSFAENNAGQIMVVDGVDGFIFDMNTDIYAQITDVDYPGGFSVTFQDGYFIVPKPGTQEYYISGINDGFTWAADDFGTASINPDNLVACISSLGNLWLLGEKSIEVHTNSGEATFPFERIPGALVQTGCAAYSTVQLFDNTIAWLGVDEQGRGVVWRAEGYNARKISTQAMEKKIAEVADLSQAYAWVYHEQGHVFYCLQIPGLDTTLVYDGSTGLWHERAWNNDGQYERHRGSTHFFFDQKTMVGDRVTGQIYQMSLNLYDDAGVEIIRERIITTLQDEKKLITHSCFELDIETGVGINSGQGSDPQIMMQYSDDSGKTYSSELWLPIGRMGQYFRRVAWRRLGSSRDRVYKITYSEPTQIQINGAFLNAT